MHVHLYHMLKENTFHITVNQLLFVFGKFMKGSIMKIIAMNGFGSGINCKLEK